MTVRQTPLVRTELALILVGLALLTPRVAGFDRKILGGELPTESAQAAVGYAQHRLWADFVEDRLQCTSDPSAKAPTLAEYREFLAGLGLKRRGDEASLLILPELDPERMPDRIQVRLDRVSPPIVMKLYVRDARGRPGCAGQLEIRVDTEDALTCRAEAESESRLLALWPVRPGPLLP